MKEIKVKMCHQCGNDFETTNGQRSYCDDCPPIQSGEDHAVARLYPSARIRAEGTYKASPPYVRPEAATAINRFKGVLERVKSFVSEAGS